MQKGTFYCAIGFIVIGVSLALLISLLITSGNLYWYFIFSICIGGIITSYGVIHLVRYFILRKKLRENPPLAVVAVAPQTVLADAAAFELQPRWTQEEVFVMQQRQHEDLNRQQQLLQQQQQASREPAPTAPPADFVQQPNRGGTPKPDIDQEIEDFQFDPVEYK